MFQRHVVRDSFLVSLLLHLLVGAATWNLSLLPVEEVAADTAAEEQYLELFDWAPVAAEPAPPTSFVDIPERLAAEAPEDPQHLALFDSRAADLVEGGQDDSAPAAAIQSPYLPQVAVRRDDPALGETAPEEPAAQNPAAPDPATGGDEASQTPVEKAGELDELFGSSGALDLESGQPEPGERDREPGPPAAEEPDLLELYQQGERTLLDPGQERGREGSPGDRGFEWDRLEMGSPEGNVQIDGTFSLSTTAWDWAPWMARFKRNVERNWINPPAWYLGVIDGHTVVQIVIERDGSCSFLAVIQSQGHESLHQAATAALRAAQPYDPLPPGFPDEHLVIRGTFIYPPLQQLREEWERARRAEEARRGGTPPRRGR